MFSVYVIYSERLQIFYKGQTSNLRDRLARHNGGLEKFTKVCQPWRLIWTTSKSSRGEAKAFEKKLKNLSQTRLFDLMLRHEDGFSNEETKALVKAMVIGSDREGPDDHGVA